MSEQKFESFRDLQEPGNPLRLLNAWDAGSARVFEAAGAPAIGTTSAGVAFALGHPDGEDLDRDAIVAATAAIVAAVEIPVSADIESGFGESPAEVSETVRRIAAAGAVGINLEDKHRAGDSPLRLIADQLERLEAARAGADAEGATIFINARTDTFLAGVGPPEERLDLARKRLREFQSVGVDGVFVPAAPLDVIEVLVAATLLPLNVLLSPVCDDAGTLAALGVARLSTGSGPYRATIGVAQQIATELLGDGTIKQMLDDATDFADVNALFER
jgi:2-methylisocitrate lyase-like PEP mutase family enzyme